MNLTDNAERILDLTTTSVGRRLIRQCYESFFSHINFSGRFRVIVTIDPTYGVDEDEIAETIRYLEALPKTEPRVAEVVIERLPENIGLQRSLMLLFAHARSRFGVHLEDDWRFFAPLDLDALVAELADQHATMIAFNSTHVSRGGTFERAGESIEVSGSRVPLLRLVHPSWASDYLPLCPHVHDAERWIPAYTRALMLDDHPDRCPDERVKDYVRANRLGDSHIVLWTRDVVVEDIGREWAAERGEAKNIGANPHHRPTQLADGQPLALERSFAWQERAHRAIPGETQTFMKRAECYAPGEFPVFLDRGQGPYVWDVDGNAYIDFIAGLGACSLGHAPTVLQAAVNSQLSKGVLTSLPTSIEVETAETVVDLFDHCDQVRFFKTGADACSAAVRLSRALTGRVAVASCGYHGWHELFTQGSEGAPVDPALRVFDPFADEGEQSLMNVLADGEVACAIIALPYAKTISKERMHAIVRAVKGAGALLVMDEIVTGFRLSLGGATGFFGIEPDLICLGKGLAAGMPLAALVGPESIMSPLAQLHVSSTYGGDMLSLAVSNSVIEHYRTTDVIDRIHRLGRQFADGANALAGEAGLAPIVHGYDPLPCLSFASDEMAHIARARRFQAACAKHGALFRRDVNFITPAHSSADIDRALTAVGHGIVAVAEGD